MQRNVVGGIRPRRAGRGVRSRLRGAGSAALLSSLALGGCYSHFPVEEGSLAPRQEVRVWLNAEGKAAVAPILGSEVTSLEGTVVRADPSGLALEVPAGVRQAGFHSELLRQEIVLRRAQMTMLQRRELDRARTAILVTGAGTALAAVAWVAMTGWTGASSDHPSGDDPPQVRVPIFFIPVR